MIFVDASAIVAILAEEKVGARVSEALCSSGAAITSPIALWEASVALLRIGRATPVDVSTAINGLMQAARIEVVSIGMPEFEVAMAAFLRFGKGRHPAQLNMGDCFAYAVAKVNKAAMLAVGDDFPQTDLKIIAY